MQRMHVLCTSRWRGEALPSRGSLPHVVHMGPGGAAMARDPPRHGGRPPKDARHHAPSHLWWPAWRRGLGVGLGRPIPWGPHEAAAAEIEACAAKHLALQHFEAVDMALDRPIGPGQCHARFDRRIVVVEPGGKTLDGLEGTRGGALEPGIELRRLPLADQGGEILGEVDRLGDLGLLRVELGELLGLGLRACIFAPEHQPRRPAWREGWGRGLGYDGERLAPALTSRWEALGLAEAAGILRDAAIAPGIAPGLESPIQ